MNNQGHLETKYWVEMVLCHPELEQSCPWEKLKATAWHDILMERPEFIRNAPKTITLSFMNASQWLEVLIAHPELDAYVPAAKSLFNKDSDAIGKLWSKLLSRHPEFAKYKPWKHLRGGDWKRLLCQQPQFIVNYERDRSQKNGWQFILTEPDQAEIIACQPSLFEHFKKDGFTSGAWQTILSSQPQLREECNLNRLFPTDLGQLLKLYPEWLDYCDTYSMTPNDILFIAESFPKILTRYDLDKFKKIGKADTPWIEKYPCLIPYTCWDFSYFYWDSLLEHCSHWLETGKRQPVNVFATDFSTESQETIKLLYGPRRRIGSLKRPLPANPKEKNLRNSIDSIMEYRFWVGLHDSRELKNTIPLHIQKILHDKDMTYEQLMISMSMMTEEECGLLLYGLMVDASNEFLDRMLLKDVDRTVQQVPAHVLLPLTIMYGSASVCYFVLVELWAVNRNAIGDFRDKAGNNALHYFFFRKPLFRPSRRTELEHFETENYQFLLDHGCNPDAPNDMGFSYSQLNKALEDYLTQEH